MLRWKLWWNWKQLCWSFNWMWSFSYRNYFSFRLRRRRWWWTRRNWTWFLKVIESIVVRLKNHILHSMSHFYYPLISPHLSKIKRSRRSYSYHYNVIKIKVLSRILLGNLRIVAVFGALIITPSFNAAMA